MVRERDAMFLCRAVIQNFLARRGSEVRRKGERPSSTDWRVRARASARVGARKERAKIDEIFIFWAVFSLCSGVSSSRRPARRAQADCLSTYLVYDNWKRGERNGRGWLVHDVE